MSSYPALGSLAGRWEVSYEETKALKGSYLPK